LEAFTEGDDLRRTDNSISLEPVMVSRVSCLLLLFVLVRFCLCSMK
jgi:hypothetical protein